jgi:hypothetical protein
MDVFLNEQTFPEFGGSGISCSKSGGNGRFGDEKREKGRAPMKGLKIAHESSFEKRAERCMRPSSLPSIARRRWRNTSMAQVIVSRAGREGEEKAPSTRVHRLTSEQASQQAQQSGDTLSGKEHSFHSHGIRRATSASLIG